MKCFQKHEHTHVCSTIGYLRTLYIGPIAKTFVLEMS